jgi:hypothetical protein
LRCRRPSDDHDSVDAAATSIAVAGLDARTFYYCYAAADSSNGLGAFSIAVNAMPAGCLKREGKSSASLDACRCEV